MQSTAAPKLYYAACVQKGAPKSKKLWLTSIVSYKVTGRGNNRVAGGMQRSRAWCGTPPILGVVNMVGTRNFTCYMGAL